MIDCGRKFIPMAYLQDLVKIMAYYKMNTLQVHLNDNGFKQYFEHNWDKTYAAFRLESETYPGLTARTPRKNLSTSRNRRYPTSWKSFRKLTFPPTHWLSPITNRKSEARSTAWITSTYSSRKLTNS